MKKGTTALTIPRAEEYLTSLFLDNFSPKTIKTKREAFHSLQDFLSTQGLLFEHLTVANFTQFKAYLLNPGRITPIYRYTRTSPLSSSSVNLRLVHVRAFLMWCLGMDYPIPLHPEKIRLLRRERKLRPDPPPLQAIEQFFQAPGHYERRCKKEKALRNRAILELFFATGIRLSELVKLNYPLSDGNRLLISGKGKKQRFVYVTPRAMQHLQAYLAFRKPPDGSPLFASRGNHRISIYAVDHIFLTYSRALGIHLTPHMLRHAFVTALMEAGAIPAAVQHLVGHESLATTSLYTHTSDTLAQEEHLRFHPLSGIPKSLEKTQPKSHRPRGRPRKIRKRGRPRKIRSTA